MNHGCYNHRKSKVALVLVIKRVFPRLSSSQRAVQDVHSLSLGSDSKSLEPSQVNTTSFPQMEGRLLNLRAPRHAKPRSPKARCALAAGQPIPSHDSRSVPSLANESGHGANCKHRWILAWIAATGGAPASTKRERQAACSDGCSVPGRAGRGDKRAGALTFVALCWALSESSKRVLACGLGQGALQEEGQTRTAGGEWRETETASWRESWWWAAAGCPWPDFE